MDASRPGEKYAVELWMAVVFHNAGSFWQTLMYDVINQKVKYVEGTSFTAWRPSLYMLHPEWMIHHGYYETAQFLRVTFLEFGKNQLNKSLTGQNNHVSIFLPLPIIWHCLGRIV